MDGFDVTKMTLKEKVAMVHGKGSWRTYSADNLPSVVMSDGPHGLRKQSENNKGINDSERATCFPAACAVASSWSRRAASLVGQSIAEEAIAQNVDLVLGPGINVKRSPLCGRNFEYFSEDPFLAGELASGYVSAMQSCKIGCCLKHFAVNSQETRRMTVDAIADERALREIYLSAFENVIKNAHPYAVMASYNKINGSSATENKHLYEILRNEWGFDGLVMSDWGATYDMGKAFSAGLDLEMPYGGKFHEDMTLQAVKDGALSESDLDRACKNVANLAYKCKRDKQAPAVDYMLRHNEIAREVAAESAVLLKNDGILPLSENSSVLVVGELAEQPRFQGAGSSHVNAVCRNFLDILTDNGINFRYEKGYSVKGDVFDDNLENSAVENADKYDVILFFGGLTDDFEGEGYDRTRLDIPFCQQRLLKRLYDVNRNIVFVAFGGAPFVTPWLSFTKALLDMYLGGQAVMSAAYDLIFGKVSPSGRLAETFPTALADTPCYNYFASDRYLDEHRESIFVGYRYYNTYGVKTQFPFGYGLSYSKFGYSDLRIEKTDGGFTASVTVTNEGNFDAYEVVQLYVDNSECGLMRAKRELRAFDKVFIKAGQSVVVQLHVAKRAFCVFYGSEFKTVKGNYGICICRDAEHVILSQKVSVDGVTVDGRDRELYPDYFADVSDGFAISEETFYKLANMQKPQYLQPERGSFTLLDTFEDMQSVRLVRTITKAVRKMAVKQSPSASADDPVAKMIYRGAMETPLISLMSIGGVPAKYVMFILHHANKRRIKALKALFGKF